MSLSFIEFAEEYKKLFPNVTPEEVNTAFKIGKLS